LERQRVMKEHAKKEKKLVKAEKEEKEQSDSDDEKKGGSLRKEISKEEAIQLRKHLEDGCEFRGLVKTAKSILEREDKKAVKVKKMAKMISKVFILSEDYDSDSDDSDDEDDLKQFLEPKKISKKLKKEEKHFTFDVENKTIALAKFAKKAK